MGETDRNGSVHTKIDYGEILFLGQCNCKCYYCLAVEMPKLQENNKNQLETHFSEWSNFDRFVETLKNNSVEIVYLSSTISEPLMYKYVYDIVIYLKEQGFKVGIRTNGYFVKDNMATIKELDAEISYSINSLNSDTSEKISSNADIVDWSDIFNEMRIIDKKCRVSIVVNRYNEKEIEETLDFLNKQSCITYVQLRRVYKYGGDLVKDNNSFNNIGTWLDTNFELSDNYFESRIYNYKGLKVSLWENVFNKDNLVSLNYFTDGVLTANNLLVPAYEEDTK